MCVDDESGDRCTVFKTGRPNYDKRQQKQRFSQTIDKQTYSFSNANAVAINKVTKRKINYRERRCERRVFEKSVVEFC
jgi:hypothetical protein